MTAAALAIELGADERTIRRAVASGAIRARRSSARRIVLGDEEREYLHAHWPAVERLRRALRTEPNVKAAILFGSTARGDDRPTSDLDLLVSLRRDSAVEASALEQRLSGAAGRSVHVTRDSAARNAPQLMVDAIADGRPLVDRDRYWPRLRRSAARYRRAAAEAQAAIATRIADQYGIELV